MFHSMSLLFCLFLRIFLSFFLHLLHLLYFSPSAFIVRYLFSLFVSCLFFLCLSSGIILVSYWTLAVPLIFCVRKDVAASADRADRCVLCSGALPVLVESWYWFLVLQNIIDTWDVHYRCADCNRAVCVRVCLFFRLFVCRYVIAARKERCGVLWIEI